MHPQIKMDEPGQCPICGMDLIPLENKTQEEAAPDEIQMSESAMKLADIETTVVTKGIPERTVYLLGTIKPDERRIAEMTARFGGRIEKLFVNFTGQEVRKGQKLAMIYSPELIAAQKELLEAVKFKDSSPGFYKAARTKLKLWDLTEEQIDKLENAGETRHYFELLSPISGTVTKRYVTLGDYVKEGSPLFEVIDLRKVWAMFDAYESDLPWIKVGDKITFSIQSLPGKNYTGKVIYIDPFIDALTRVAGVRVELNNPKLELKPEMYVSGILHSEMKKQNDILIPKSSVLWTGKRAVVYVKVPDRTEPSFVYREVTLGPDAGNFYVVLNGLTEGEEIATNGVFKIDAAAQLAGKPSMMNPEGGKVNTMPGMDMGGGDVQETENTGSKRKSKVNVTAEVPVAFKKQLGFVVNEYLKMKDAFVKSDEKKAVETAMLMLEALNKVDMTLLKGDLHNKWMQLQKPIKDNLNGIIQMDGLEMKRRHFSIVSEKISGAIKIFGVMTKEVAELYYEFCPMAFDNKGAFWVSETREIFNPYFGDSMLKCGEVKEVFKTGGEMP
jgi:Cu(I)/Ag(I) efflux system membrane fusion protein